MTNDIRTRKEITTECMKLMKCNITMRNVGLFHALNWVLKYNEKLEID